MGSFGDKFRQARENKKLSLDDVSNVTKIGSRMLKAIEDEHFDQLPGGVFNKGFIRAYARHLGLNDEEAVTEYLAVLRQAQIDAQNAPIPAPPVHQPIASPTTKPTLPLGKFAAVHPKAQPEAGTKELPHLQLPKAEHIRPRPPAPGGNLGAIPWQVPAIVVVLVVTGMIFWNRHSRSARADATTAPRATASAPTSSASRPPTSDSAAHSPASVLPGSSAAPQPHASRQPAGKPLASSVQPVPASESGSADENEITARNLTPHHSAAVPPVPAPTLTLVIRAAENSWVSVVADGQQVTQETLIAPAQTRVRASREIVVRVGNSAGVSFLFNEKQIPAQGNEGEVKTFVFDNTGLRPASPAPPADPVR